MHPQTPQTPTPIAVLDQVHHFQNASYTVMYSMVINPWRACVTVVNPRRACAARVTVLRLSVCLSVCLLQLAWLTWRLNL